MFIDDKNDFLLFSSIPFNWTTNNPYKCNIKNVIHTPNEALFAHNILPKHFSMHAMIQTWRRAHRIYLISYHPFTTFVYCILTQFYYSDHISSFHFLPKHNTLAYKCAFVCTFLTYMFLVNLKISALPNSKKFDRPYVCINILHNMNMKCIYVPIYTFETTT